MKRILVSLSLLTIGFYFTSCATYYMTIDNFCNTLKQISDSTVRYRYETGAGTSGIVGAVLFNGKKFDNGIKTLECTDLNNKKIQAKVNRNTMIRFTNKRGGKMTYYFDTMFMKNDSVIVGRYNRKEDLLIPFKKRDITQVEIITSP